MAEHHGEIVGSALAAHRVDEGVVLELHVNQGEARTAHHFVIASAGSARAMADQLSRAYEALTSTPREADDERL